MRGHVIGKARVINRKISIKVCLELLGLSKIRAINGVIQIKKYLNIL